MKYLVCSDIHGSKNAVKKILKYFFSYKCDRLIILGDILYHGPRNPLPKGYSPKDVVKLLSPLKDKIIACRGNCDAEVDQKVLPFSIMKDFVQFKDEKINIFCSHGHVFAPLDSDGKMPLNCEDAKMPLLEEGTIFFYGHTHISVLKKEKIVVCNPGSPSLAKGGTKQGFAILDVERGILSLCNLRGITYSQCTICQKTV